MRSAAVFLLLLLCLHWTWAQGESGGVTESDITQTERENREEEVQFEIPGTRATHDQSSSQTNISPDIWTELKELRDMVIEHRIKIEKLEQENTATQARLTASESKNAVLEVRLNSSENVVKELQIENKVLEARLSTREKEVEELKKENTVLEGRMNTSENMISELKTKNTVLEARMSSSENEVEELKRENAALEARMSSSENVVRELQRENADRPKVAFSVGLTNAGLVGPLNTQITLKFSKIFTNIGQTYNPTTGIFTAPVRGVYYFRFTLRDNRSGHWTAAHFYHNDKLMIRSVDYSYNSNDAIASNALVLQLEKGDVIYIVLESGYSIFDDTLNHTTFSGFLLYAL